MLRTQDARSHMQGNTLRERHDAKCDKHRGAINLYKSFAVDASSALLAAAAVSPVMTIIDKAVVENAAGRQPIWRSVRCSSRALITRPHSILATRPFGAMGLMYLCTYLTANIFDSLTSFNEARPPASSSSSSMKLAAVTGVNIGLAMNKDSIFARSFGASASASARLPRISYVPFLIRDAMTLYATFNLPQLAAPQLPDAVEIYVGKLSLAQLAFPAASQFITTPLHLLGLDLYNRQGRLGVRERLKAARSAWLSTSVARACRIIPAYGVGGVLNNMTRNNMMNWIGT